VDDDAFQVPSDVLSGNPQRLHSLRSHPTVTPLVTLRIVSEVVSYSIHFNCETSGLAEEIEDERPERMLAPELKSLWTQSQHSPEPDL
jgi:hypothetical protein